MHIERRKVTTSRHAQTHLPNIAVSGWAGNEAQV